MPRDRLLAESRRTAIELSQYLLKRSGLNLPDDVLTDYQQELTDHHR